VAGAVGAVLVLGLVAGVAGDALTGDDPPPDDGSSSPTVSPPPAVLWSSSDIPSGDWPGGWRPSMAAGSEHVTRATIGGRSDVMQVVAGGDNDGFTGLGVQLRSFLDDLGILGRDRLTLRYRVYLPDDWEPHTGGKLPGLGGLVGSRQLYEIPAGGDYHEDGWSGRVVWTPPRAGDPPGIVPLDTYLYVRSAAGVDVEDNRNPDNDRPYGISVPFRRAPDPDHPWSDRSPKVGIRRGQWSTVELRYVMNTPGRADGAFSARLDGRLAVDLRDVEYRTEGHDGLGVNALLFDSYFGGPSSNDTDERWYLDDVEILEAP
jgi:hypothetical protein